MRAALAGGRQEVSQRLGVLGHGQDPGRALPQARLRPRADLRHDAPAKALPPSRLCAVRAARRPGRGAVPADVPVDRDLSAARAHVSSGGGPRPGGAGAARADRGPRRGRDARLGG